MDFEKYKNEFEIKASSQGFSKEIIQLCLDYAKPLIENQVPVIYNTSNLCALVGYNKRFIKRSVVYTSYYYRDFEITKKNGKKRQISEPLPSLKEIQYWILKNILEKIKISAFAKAYKRNSNLKENVRYHQSQNVILNIDITDFFPSIKLDNVEHIFKNLGYSDVISNLLAKLCTRNNALPQGAPTSPYLSNIFFYEIDNKIADYCIEKKIRYTRFADDLTFSGDFNVEEFKKIIVEILTSHNLKINRDKTKILYRNQRQIVTGVVVNEKLQVPFYKRNKLRQEIYFIKKFGILNHKKHLKINNKNYISHLLGKINFILQMNSFDEEFREYKNYLIQLKKDNPLC